MTTRGYIAGLMRLADRIALVMTRRRRSPSQLVSLAFACTAFMFGCHVDIPSGIFACSAQADCPSGMVCSEETSTCVRGTATGGPASGTGGEPIAGNSPAAGSSGASTAGSAGSVSMPAGSGAGASGLSGAGGASGQPSMAGNAAPAGAGGAEACTTPAAFRCAANGGGKREQCTAGFWTAAADCAAGQVCSTPASGPAACIAIADLCRGNEGKAVCDAQGKLSLCNPDGTVASDMQCKSANHCQAGLADKTCAVCIANEEHHCSGVTLQVCAADGKSFQKQTDCDTAALCNELVGMCTTSTCAPGKFACQTNTLVKCNADGTGFDTMTPCGSGTCDAAGGDCNMCAPAQKSCDATSNNTILTCNAAGQGYDKSVCTGTMKCAGAGQCVECIASADCGANKACQNSKCVCAPQCAGKVCGADGCGGTCGSCASGTSCNTSGLCACVPACTGKKCGSDGCGGTCGTCTSTQTCNTSGQCAENCGNGVKDPGEDCDVPPNAPTGACPSCKTAFCGDGYTQTGVEECDLNDAGWTGKCDVNCKRIIYTNCPSGSNNDCSSTSHCAVYNTATSQGVCAPTCASNAACPLLPNYTAACNFGGCVVICNNRVCPTGMSCVPNITFIDTQTQAMSMVDVCVIAPH
jgi:hypothetical protein